MYVPSSKSRAAFKSLEITVQAVVPCPVRKQTWLRWFSGWLGLLGYETAELTLRLTSDDEIQALNRQFRSLDEVTDVLSFPAEPDLSTGGGFPPYLGDIVISVPEATRQSAKFGHSIDVELCWLAVHGLLHLLGWDHPDDDRWLQMVMKQADLLKGVNVDYDWTRVYSSILD
ncbi:MAG: rRNA maturation RNase YbeY [Gemmatimonadaceae bacterium]|nr:rRNA maturation RNase YbeY [Gloeobacterales cyanobacterium ES-bin-141]